MIVGREAELTALTAAFEQMLAGRGSVLFLTGEAGLGKTTLVHSWISDGRLKISDSNNGARLAPKSEISHQQSYIFLESACSIPIGNVDVGRLEALQPWIDVIAQLESTVAASPSPAKLNLGKIIRDVAPAWAMAIPMVGELAHAALETVRLVNEHREGMRQPDSTANPNAQNQQQVFQQYVNLIASVSATQPLVIFLDDLHWADTSSCNLLFYLARQITDKRILVIATYRQDDAMQANDGKGHAIISVKNEILRYETGREIALGSLSQQDIRDLLKASTPSRSSIPSQVTFETWLLKISGGNSLFVTQFVKTLKEDGLLTDQGEFIGNYESVRVPPTALAVVEERTRRLDDATRELLMYATAEGEEFTTFVLEQLTEKKPLALLKDLQRATAQGLITQKGKARMFANQTTSIFGFSHALFHKALYDQLIDGQKDLLHRQCYDLLLTEWNRLGETRQRTTSLAMKLLTHAERCEEWATVADVALIAAREFWSAYNEDEALAMIARVHDAVARDPRAAALDAEAHHLRGRVDQLRGRFEDAVNAYRSAESGFRSAGNVVRAIDAMNRQAWCLVSRSEFEESALTAQRAIDESRASGYVMGEADAVNAIGNVRSAQCRYNDALSNYHNSLAIRRSISDEWGTAAMLGNIGRTHLALCRYAEARTCMQESIAMFESIGDRPSFALNLCNIGLVMAAQGQLDAAAENWQRSLEVSESIGDRAGVARILLNIGNASMDRGDYPTALEKFERCRTIGEVMGDRVVVAGAVNNLGRVHLLKGELEPALKHFEESLHMMQSIGAQQGSAIALLNIGAVRQSQGRYAEALEWYEQCLTVSESIGDRGELASAFLNIGDLHTETRRFPEARVALERALQISNELGIPVLQADSLGNLAELEIEEATQLSREAQAVHLQLAKEHLEECLRVGAALRNRHLQDFAPHLDRVNALLGALLQ